MAKIRFVPNRRNTPLLWPETDRLLHRLAAEVAARNNAPLSADDPRRVVVGSNDQPARRRHRAGVVAASGPAVRDQARTNRLLSALSQTRL